MLVNSSGQCAAHEKRRPMTQVIPRSVRLPKYSAEQRVITALGQSQRALLSLSHNLNPLYVGDGPNLL